MTRILLVCLLLMGSKVQAQTGAKRPNIVFIMVDDLRPELGCYGNTTAITPNIDKLARQGTTFLNSFCNVPVCGASRASILTGVRPTRTRFTVARSKADVDLPGHLSLARYLKQNGYTTLAIGKVYHTPQDDVSGWSRIYPQINTKSGGNYMNTENISVAGTAVTGKAGVTPGPAFEVGRETNDFAYKDGLLAQTTNAILDTLKLAKNPFFLAVGFFKPHLPFVAPKKYYDLYDRKNLALADNQFMPTNAPAISVPNSGELRQYAGVPTDRILPDEYALNLRHAYLASVSFVDAMIGEVLNKLDAAGLRENTIVVLIGDHGWSLGEHTIWGKHNTYETAVRAPLIISAPRIAGNTQSQSLAEFVDIYPTLTQLTGLPIPKHCQGTSLVPVLNNPLKSLKNEVFIHWRGGEGIHTNRYAYTEWVDPKTKALKARMLYDLQKDRHENNNVAELPEYKNVVAELSAILQKNIATR